MSTQTTPPTTPRPLRERRWVAVVFFISLALNLIGLGVLVANVGDDARRGYHGMRAWHNVPDEAREVLREGWHEQRPVMRAYREKLETAVEDAVETFEAEPFDRAGSDAALKHVGDVLAEASEGMVVAFSPVLLDALEKMDADDREDLVEYLGKTMERRMERRDRRDRKRERRYDRQSHLGGWELRAPTASISPVPLVSFGVW